MKNICRFVPSNRGSDEIHILNFVYEYGAAEKQRQETSPVYRLHLVAAGQGCLKQGEREYALMPGDIFFALPARPYRLSGDGEFVYMYISFLGLKANALMERLKIHREQIFFSGFRDILALWENAIHLPGDMADLASQGILLYTLARLGERQMDRAQPETDAGENAAFLKIKKYMDDHFADPDLSLDLLSQVFSYNKKYLSSAFKRHFHLGISEYLTTLRLHHACFLMQQHYKGVGNIAGQCGFRDALYFSRVFKERMGLSPRAYMDHLPEGEKEGSKA